jgi:hypothetical protein
VSALVYGIVRSTDAGWTDTVTIAVLAAGVLLVGLFVVCQQRAEQPIMPLRLLATRERAGAYAARFLFNGALLSFFFFFMTQYLQGVSGYSALQAGLAFLPVTLAALAAATAIPRFTPRLGNALLVVVGCAAMLAGTAWMSRVSVDTGYLAGIAAPMIVFGIGQGLGLSTLTTGGMAGVAPADAGAAGGLVNVAHHRCGLGLGILVTVFAAAGSGADDARGLLAQRVSASLTAAAAFLVLALVVTLIAHPRKRVEATVRRPDVSPLPGSANPARPAAQAVAETTAAA